MSRSEKNTLVDLVVLSALGGVLLFVVFSLPDAGRALGKSFVQIAISARWDHFGDWGAAWCSVKIILLTLGLFFFGTLSIYLAGALGDECAELVYSAGVGRDRGGRVDGSFFLRQGDLLNLDRGVVHPYQEGNVCVGVTRVDETEPS